MDVIKYWCTSYAAGYLTLVAVLTQEDYLRISELMLNTMAPIFKNRICISHRACDKCLARGFGWYPASIRTKVENR